MKTTERVLSIVLIICIVCCMTTNTFAVEPRAVAMPETASPHSSISTAQRIYQDYTITGNMGAVRERDFYVITFTDAGKVNFWLGNIPDGCNYNLYIYDSSGTCITKSTGLTNQEVITNYSVAANSTYYVEARSASGYSTTEYYALRCKWYPADGFTYYYNKNPNSTIGGFSVNNMTGLMNTGGYNIVERIKDVGCYIAAYAMILRNLNKTTMSAYYDPRTNTNRIMEADPISLSLANMGFPTMNSNGQLNSSADPASIQSFGGLANSFGTSFTRYNVSALENDVQRIVAITYYLSLHPEGIMLRFHNGSFGHTIVAVGSSYVASETEIDLVEELITVEFAYAYEEDDYSLMNIMEVSIAAEKYINDNNGGSFITVYEPARICSNDGSSTLTNTWLSEHFSWDDFQYIEVFD